MPKVLVACVGNIFLGDDGFGVEVARRLAKRPLPPGVQVVDFGIRGYDLAYALMEDWELVILVDAVPRGGESGTIYVMEVDPAALEGETAAALPVDGHTMDPVSVLRLVRMLGGEVKPMLLVGCEPATPSDPDEGMELSPTVRAAVNEATRAVENIIEKHIVSASAMAGSQTKGEQRCGE